MFRLRTEIQLGMKPDWRDPIDNSMFKWVEDHIQIVYDGKRLPTYKLYSTQRLSEYLQEWDKQDETGNPIIHHIATISGITNELRFAISEIDEFGQVKLKNEIYGKVATIDGQDISSRNKRFSHATFQGWRPDRSAESCKFRESYLNSLIL